MKITKNVLFEPGRQINKIRMLWMQQFANRIARQSQGHSLECPSARRLPSLHIKSRRKRRKERSSWTCCRRKNVSWFKIQLESSERSTFDESHVNSQILTKYVSIFQFSSSDFVPSINSWKTNNPFWKFWNLLLSILFSNYSFFGISILQRTYSINNMQASKAEQEQRDMKNARKITEDAEHVKTEENVDLS